MRKLSIIFTVLLSVQLFLPALSFVQAEEEEGPEFFVEILRDGADFYIDRGILTKHKVELSEGEASVKIETLLNGKTINTKTSKKNGDHYSFYTTKTPERKKFDVKNGHSVNDTVHVKVTTFDDGGKVLSEEIALTLTLKMTVPNGKDFCANPPKQDLFYDITFCSWVQAQQINETDEKVEQVKEDVKEVKKDVKDVKEEVKEVKKDVKEVKQEVKEVKQDVAQVKEDVEEIKEKIVTLDGDITKLSLKVQETINEVNELKQYTISLKDIIFESEKHNGVPEEVWLRTKIDIHEEGASAFHSLTKTILSFITVPSVSAETTEVIADEWTKIETDELVLEEGNEYEVAFVTTNEDGNTEVEGYHFLATSEGVEVEEAEVHGPFIVETEPETEIATDSTETAAPVIEYQVVEKTSTFSIVIGYIGMLCIGILIGILVSNKIRITKA
ncbi:hypothetical protein [Sutcliffiella cohnii]|uniref:hypothetical protein n=1 Tax=Sutcliffiella cohnii TaxID=33932 RepID=UPI002E1C637D|nr:hypothetical protein [Sutcliffiella cohnii]